MSFMQFFGYFLKRSVAFDSYVVKVQTAALMLFTPREEAAVRCLRKDGRVDGEQWY
jgi:hypothetical protein